MKNWLSFAFLSLAYSSWAGAGTSAIIEEKYYQHFKQMISARGELAHKGLIGFTAFEQGLFVDALWDLLDEGSHEAMDVLGKVNAIHYDLLEKLRLGLLKIRYKNASQLDKDLEQDLENALQAPVAETKLIYTLAAYEEELLRAGHTQIIRLAELHPQYHDIKGVEERRQELSQNVLADLFYRSPDVTTYMNGEYARSVKLFMFCRSNRLYPCLMVMRNPEGEVVRNQDGSLWAHASLASSARGLPSYTRNGNTPAGVWTIDSVMPGADQQLSFGNFRRMILNFVPKSNNEVLIKSLLPESSLKEDWWYAATVARDIGRNLFRIHGTGKINHDPNTPYWPFMRTSGCIAQRENIYHDVTYRDQRELLDAIMVALGHEATYDNEVKVKGVLYLIEVDDQNAPVTTEDLHAWGIE